MDISMFDIIENGVGNKEIISIITEKLKEKYNEEFHVKMIGNRYGTYDDNTVTTYCFPKNNENLLFTTTMDKEQTLLEDDYNLRKVMFELAETIKNSFDESSIESVVKTDVIGVNKLEKKLTVQEFIKRYNASNFMAHIIISEDISEEDLRKIYSKIESKYKNIYLNTAVYSIDKDKFGEFAEFAKKVPVVTKSIVNEYSVKNKKNIKIFEGKIITIK